MYAELIDQLRTELRRTLARIRTGADARESFRTLMSLAGSLVGGGNMRLVNDHAAHALAALYAADGSEGDLLTVVLRAALANKSAIDAVKKQHFGSGN
jgi:hypothetical protein